MKISVTQEKFVESMEAESLVQLKDHDISESQPLPAPLDNDLKASLMKRQSLAAIQHPLSSSCAKHNNDFLPAEILANLTSQYDAIEDLGPQGNGRLKRGRGFPKVYPKRPPDNLWNHAKTREKFKHLTDQPPCTCGAGRDISFLYDALPDKKNTANTKPKGSPDKQKVKNEGTFSTPVTNKDEPSKQESDREATQVASKDGSLIPETLVPTEFHIVKNPGVMGLEIHEGKFTTTMDNHEKHLTLFPSMKPSGRQEAVLLKKTMNELLQRVGVEEIKKDKDQPTQIHSLLDLVKQEQNIYNLVFNEVIRQVSIECVERGELLADLRKRYASLLDKVPRHVKSLHEEVLAQRALDRRLTEELTRFKTSITLLTRELDVVQEHDREVTKQAVETQNELNAALKESEKNASLLAEYHELYELQRKRLEFQISKLIGERDLWAGASYTLSLKVAQKHSLKTAKRLHLHEKAWYKLSGHFAILLSDIDSAHLQELTKFVQSWQEIAESFDSKLIKCEQETYRKLNYVSKQVAYWGRQFARVVTPDEGTVHPPEKDVVTKLHEDMKRWEEVFNSEVERFSGDVLLSSEDDLVKMNRFMDSWSEVALKIFQRHPMVKNTRRPEHEAMLVLNQQVEKLHKSLRLRMTGENGLAKGLIHLINVLDGLGNKLNGFSHGYETLLDPEWVRLADFLQSEWPDLLTELVELVHPRKETPDDKSHDQLLGHDDVDLQILSKSAYKWLKDTSKSVENADASILDHVSNCHSKMVRWIVTVLLRLAPDLEEDLFSDEDVNIGIGAAIISESTTEEIQERGQLLFRLLRQLSGNLYTCCNGIVNNDFQRRHDIGTEMAEVEAKDLKKLKSECDGWIKTAILLVEEFSGDVIQEEKIEDESENGKSVEESGNSGQAFAKEQQVNSDFSSRPQDRDNAERKEEKTALPATLIEAKTEAVHEKEVVEDQGREHSPESTKLNDDSIQMHVIGEDDNVKVKVLDIAAISNEMTSNVSQDLALENKSSLEALGTIEKLQEQLVETEERAQMLEERAISAETQLKEALERIRALERTARRASQDTTAEYRTASALSSLPEKNNNNESLPGTPVTLSRALSGGTSRATPTTPKSKSRQINREEAIDKS
ncbi:axonemal dynein light chain domain-containing protein 1-like isoform X3 [Rhopilema esculentum]|uniref:axonemal dynein light chain domain-containing protein 1-like isoform X3 n=1 Tax=Rhopilema esculentum TaxID=499914 RepID=UPI0031D6BE71